METPERLLTICHDGIGHHPLGAGSYYFKEDLIGWLCSQIQETAVHIFIGAQPNSCPHMGNICNITTAFAMGQLLKAAGKDASIFFDAVDTAPSPCSNGDGPTRIDGITYQKSLRWTGAADTYMNQFGDIIETLSQISGVAFTIRKQADILGSRETLTVLKDILTQHEQLGKLFSHKNSKIGIRATCPVASCGLADKGGVRNQYLEDSVQFHCPTHGAFSLSLDDPEDVGKLELNTPMRNLLRNRVFGSDRSAHWIQVVGADYAGFYQEQLLWRPISSSQPARLPLIIYSPAVLDWSGAKISKSLYVDRTAYDYLKGTELEYMLDYSLVASSGISLENIYSVCYDWVENPYKLFRAYSIYYLHKLILDAKKMDQDVKDAGRDGVSAAKQLRHSIQ